MGGPENLVDGLRFWARQEPARCLYIFLAHGEVEAGSLAYGELDRRARAIAARLRSTGLAGARALLVFPPGLELVTAFWGCLYAGTVAVPVQPPRRKRPHPGLASIALDAEPAAVLTAGAATRAADFSKAVPSLAGARWLDTAEIGDGEAEDWTPPEIESSTPAFLQYTSGSTSTPKGVRVSHGNLVHNEREIARAFETTAESTIVSWLPSYHDMGLIGGILHPAWVGARCILFSPTAFLQRPARWLEAISRYRATVSGGPDFAYDLCSRRIHGEDRAKLDLSSWRVAFNGAEPVRAATLERFADVFAPQGFDRRAFYPCYGLAESTLFVTGGSPAEEPRIASFDAAELEAHRAAASHGGRRLVSSGRRAPGLELRIVDPETRRCLTDGRVGEIWIAGPSVAQGYRNRPEATEEVFRARLADDPGAGPFLRTGDLGFVDGGELFVAGRLKDLIVLRGRNLHPQDVEATAAAAHPALEGAGGAAFAVDEGDEERLVVVHEIDRRSEEAWGEAAEELRRRVAEEHEAAVFEVVVVRRGTVPRTTSGKIRRRACRELYRQGRLEAVGRTGGEAGAVAERTPAEQTVAEERETAPEVRREDLLALAPEARRAALEAHLRRQVARAARCEVGQVGRDVPLIRLLSDSLAVVELTHEWASRLGASLAPEAVFQGLTLEDLTEEIAKSLPLPRVREVRREAAPREAPLSEDQRALWHVERLAPEAGIYNLAVAARTSPPPDLAVLRRALGALARRHAVLRTTFHEVHGEPVRRIEEGLEPSLAEVDAYALSHAELERELRSAARCPFDLEAGPLFRVTVFRRGGERDVTLFVLHHLVSDFWALTVLVRELGALYAARTRESLPELAATYDDHVAAERRRLASPQGEELRRFWRRRLEGTPVSLELVPDRPRPPVRTFRGAAASQRLSRELGTSVRRRARDGGVTRFVVLLAAYQLLLHRLSGQDDLVVGSAAAGRTDPAFAGVMGYFVHPVVLRCKLPATVAELLGAARERVREAFVNQDYPLLRVAEDVYSPSPEAAPGTRPPERDASRAPLCQAAFVYLERPASDPRLADLAAFALGEPGGRLELGGLRLESVRLEPWATDFDLILSAGAVGDGETAASLKYNTDLFDRTTARRMLGRWRNLVAAIGAAGGERRLSELEWLDAAERRQLLGEWNDHGLREPPARTVVERITEVAETRSDAPAVVCQDRWVSYGELDRSANRLGRFLRRQGVERGDVVAIRMERSPEMVIAALATMRAGGAYLPMDPDHPPERVAYVLEDSRARVVLVGQAPPADSFGLGRAAESAGGACPTKTKTKTRTLEISAARGESSEPLRISLEPDDLAYVVYTSGSTGRPKGVAVSHRGLPNLLAWYHEYFAVTPDDRSTQTAGLSFDATVLELWPWLTAGASVHLVEEDVRLDPARLLAWYLERRITLAFLVTPLAEAFFREADFSSASRGAKTYPGLWGWEGRDLGGGAGSPPSLPLRVVTTAGDRLHRVPEGLPFRVNNNYGPTEATVDTTSGWIHGGEETPAIGRPVANVRVYLSSRRLELLAVGVPGELTIAGPCLARGYLGRPGLTAERFVPDPFGGVPGERLYRTGDLARHRPNGELDFLGRIDHQVKVRGVRIELGEVEAVLREHPRVREAVVVAVGRESDVRLAAYVVLSPGERAELAGYLAQKLPGHMVPGVFVELDELPLTSNGKVDRRALPDPEWGADTAFVAPRTPTETLLARIWGEVLGVARVGAGRSFFELGGHSLLATRVAAEVRGRLGVELPLSRLFEAPSLAELAAELDRAKAAPETSEPVPPITARARGGPLPLSFSQERLWILDRLEPGNASYNMAGGVDLEGLLDPALLGLAFGELTARHETLRTTFPSEGGRPVQRVAPAAAVDLPVIDLEPLGESRGRREAERLLHLDAATPFDLARGPLLRVRLLRFGPRRWLLTVNLHHIVSDGWSLGVLGRELGAFYGASARKPLPLEVQYADYAVWQRQWLEGEVEGRQLAYWRERLAGLAALELPADRPRPAIRTFRGRRFERALSPELTRRLEAFARRSDASLFMVLLAGLAALLGRLAGSEDVAVGSPIAGRHHGGTEGLIGMFLNHLVLRTDLSGRPSFARLVDRVREAALGAYAHQDLPFERLLDELRPERDLSRTPLFQVYLNMLHLPPLEVRLDGVESRPVELPDLGSKFDLTFYVGERGGALHVDLNYNADLFDERRIEILLGQYASLLDQAAADPERPVGELDLVTAETRPLLPDPRRPLDGSWRGAVHELFRAEAEREPGREAVVDLDGSRTYRELAEYAARLSRRLLGAGLGRGEAVAIYAHRSAALVGAVLGTLEAGGAFVVLDPGYPPGRLAEIVRRAAPGAWIAVTAAGPAPPELEAVLEELGCPRIELGPWLPGQVPGELADFPGESPKLAVGPDDVALVAFTSGSTGEPKGIVGRHGPLSHFLPFQRERFRLEPGERYSLLSGLAHDPLQRDLFTPLALGGTIVIPDPRQIFTSGYLARWMAESEIGVAHLTPAMGQLLADGATPEAAGSLVHLRWVLLVGDVLTRRDVERLRRLAPGVTCVNLYGSTETQRAVGFYVSPPGESGDGDGREVLPLGRGMPGVDLLVLNAAGRLTGVGELGEISVRSPHLAAGYLGDAELTAARFAVNPATGKKEDRLYRTGDLGRYRPDGNVVFAGRADQQVKIRGFRIELGEVEARLGRVPGVREAAVVASGPSEKRRLIAYFVPEKDARPSSELLRRSLTRTLPGYMIPSAFVVLEAMPLTPNGKIDRRALLSLASDSGSADGKLAYQAPRTELETTVARVLREVLGVERVGVDDNFFDLGGTSLLLVRLHARLEEELGREILAMDLFNHPTVSSLALHLAGPSESLPAASDRTEKLKRGRDRLRQRRRKRVAEVST